MIYKIFRTFRQLFYQLKKNVNENRYLEEQLEAFKYKIIKRKVTVKNMQSEVGEAQKLRKKEANK